MPVIEAVTVGSHSAMGCRFSDADLAGTIRAMREQALTLLWVVDGQSLSDHGERYPQYSAPLDSLG
jgi:hypothetical protein